MIWQRVRFALLAAMLVAAAALPVRAEEEPKPAPVEASKPVPSQEFCTVMVKELVPEPYTCTKTVYKIECHEEKYTAYWTVRRYIGKGASPHELTSSADVINFVKSTPGAIGYIDEADVPPGINVLLK